MKFPMGVLLLASLTGISEFVVAGPLETNQPSARIAASLFFGTGAHDEAARKVREITSVTPYKPSQAQSIEEVCRRAMEAIKKEEHPIDAGYTSAANIEMNTGNCTVLLGKAGAEHYQVSFDSAGRITSIGGATGYHGEGGWHRDYIRGQLKNTANGSQQIRLQTNTPAAAADSRP